MSKFSGVRRIEEATSYLVIDVPALTALKSRFAAGRAYPVGVGHASAAARAEAHPLALFFAAVELGKLEDQVGRGDGHREAAARPLVLGAGQREGAHVHPLAPVAELARYRRRHHAPRAAAAPPRGREVRHGVHPHRLGKAAAGVEALYGHCLNALSFLANMG